MRDDKYGVTEEFRRIFLGKKVISVDCVIGEEGVTVCLLFEGNFQLNYTYNEKFCELGRKYKQAMLDKDIKEMLGEAP
mgnify:CR=1 FL=1